MTNQSLSSKNGKQGSLVNAILVTGLLAGFLDITAAMVTSMVLSGGKPMGVLLFVASGVFGQDAFSGGLGMAFLGLLFHFIIAYSFTTLFFVVYPKLPFLRKWVIAGLCYGLVIWSVMNLIVLPMTNVQQFPFHAIRVLRGIIVIMLAVGLPVSFGANRYYSRSSS